MRGALAIAIACSTALLLRTATTFPENKPAAPTFYRDVLPILQKHCQNCHRPDGMAPMSLLFYEQARPWARAIAEKIAGGSMPPWHAEAPSGTPAWRKYLDVLPAVAPISTLLLGYSSLPPLRFHCGVFKMTLGIHNTDQ